MDVLFALSSSLLACAFQKKDSLTGSELENLCSYASRFPADFAAMFFRGLIQIEGMNMKLTKVSSFAAWMRKNKRYL